MKTQILRHLLLAVIALLFSFNINGSKLQVVTVCASCTFIKEAIKTSNENNNKGARIKSCIDLKQQTLPSESEHVMDHDFESFNLEHEKHKTFWEDIFNKFVSVIYYLVLVVGYLPYKFLR
jgi:hypothetical protein